MRKANEVYNNGQKVSEQDGNTLTYYFENGDIKAQGKYTDGKMQGKWIFNKKEGYLWQIGHFNEDGGATRAMDTVQPGRFYPARKAF